MGAIPPRQSHAATMCGKVNWRGSRGEESVDIAVWLHGLGMQQYEEAFRDNAIDAAVLPELTAEDLTDLGVSLVGHRRKLLAAIATLGGDVGPVPEPPTRCSRSSTSSTALPGSHATISPRRSWRSSRRCSLAPHRRRTMWCSSPICCHCQLRSATHCRTSVRSERRKGQSCPRRCISLRRGLRVSPHGSAERSDLPAPKSAPPARLKGYGG